MASIAVIDDDAPIGAMLDEVLRREGHDVLHAYSGTEALYLLRERRPDLILLDLMMPGLSGEEVLPHLDGIPVIVMSAKAGIDDKVGMLTAGAADYVTKPFDIRELLARIAAQLRIHAAVGTAAGTPVDGSPAGAVEGRTPASAPASVLPAGAPASVPSAVPERELHAGRITLDPSTRAVSVDDTPVRLTRTEYAILKLLMRNRGQVVTRSTILDRIRDDTPDCTEGSLKIHVSNLRGKLRAVTGLNHIEAVWGIGFTLAEGPAAGTAQSARRA